MRMRAPTTPRVAWRISMKTFVIGIVTLVATMGVACSSNNDRPPGGPSCQPSTSPSSSSTSPCDECTQARCETMYRSAVSDCSDYVACNCACAPNDIGCHQGCAGKISQACQNDIESAQQCQRQTCAAECGGGSGSSGENNYVDAGLD